MLNKRFQFAHIYYPRTQNLKLLFLICNKKSLKKRFWQNAEGFYCKKISVRIKDPAKARDTPIGYVHEPVSIDVPLCADWTSPYSKKGQVRHL